MKKIIGAVAALCMVLPAMAQNFYKRGICYNSLNDAELDSIKGGNIAWSYNWAQSPTGEAEEKRIGPEKELDFYPMIWGGNQDFQDMYDRADAYLASHPGVKVLLGFNEPMMRTDKYGGCDLSPKHAAKLWPKLEALAEKYGCQLGGPALTWGFEKLLDDGKVYGAPEVWMNEWIKQYKKANKGREPRFDYIVLHSYMDYPEAVKWFCETYGGMYKKPVLLTEFCAWSSEPGETLHCSAEGQLQSMICKLEYMDQDPNVAGYAWFMSHCPVDAIPFNGMWYQKGGDGSLTELGYVYTYMSNCDPSKWHKAGDLISATDYVNSSNYDLARGEKFFDYKLLLGTSTDETNDFPLEIRKFNNKSFANYQIDFDNSGTYRLEMNLSTDNTCEFQVFLDGEIVWETTDLASTDEKYKKIRTDSFTVDAGQHTIKVKYNGGGRNVKMSTIQIVK